MKKEILTKREIVKMINEAVDLRLQQIYTSSMQKHPKRKRKAIVEESNYNGNDDELAYERLLNFLNQYSTNKYIYLAAHKFDIRMMGETLLKLLEDAKRYVYENIPELKEYIDGRILTIKEALHTQGSIYNNPEYNSNSGAQCTFSTLCLYMIDELYRHQKPKTNYHEYGSAGYKKDWSQNDADADIWARKFTNGKIGYIPDEDK